MKGMKGSAGLKIGNTGNQMVPATKKGGNTKKPDVKKGGDLRAFTKALNQALRGRGGGKPEFVQGSVQANREEILAFFSSGCCDF